MREALRLVQEEGLETRRARHLSNHRTLRAGLAALGIRLVGSACNANNVLLLLAALEQCLTAQASKIAPGAGVAAALASRPA